MTGGANSTRTDCDAPYYSQWSGVYATARTAYPGADLRRNGPGSQAACFAGDYDPTTGQLPKGAQPGTPLCDQPLGVLPGQPGCATIHSWPILTWFLALLGFR